MRIPGTPGPARPLQTEKNTQIDGLRALAAFSVAIFHSVLEFDARQIAGVVDRTFWEMPDAYARVDKAVLSLANGQAAVAVFFVISGAVLFGSLARSGDAGVRPSARFALQRCFRIYPALWVALGALAAVMAYLGFPVGTRDLARNAALLDFGVLGQSWTLQVELVAVPFILASYAAHRAWGARGIVGAYAATWLAFRLPWLSPYLDHPRFYTLCFTLGFLVTTPVGRAAAGFLGEGAWAWLVAALLCARPLIPARVGSMDTSLAGITLLFLSAALLVAQLYYKRAGALGRLLESPRMARWGRTSYSFYLFYVPIMKLVHALVLGFPEGREHPVECGLVQAAVVIALTLPVASVSEQFIERPTIALGRRVGAALAGS